MSPCVSRARGLNRRSCRCLASRRSLAASSMRTTINRKRIRFSSSALATWRSVFGGDPNILGRRVTLDGAAYAVIGVMPPSFAFPTPQTQFWTLNRDLVALGGVTRANAPRRGGSMLARLADGVTLRAAAAGSRCNPPRDTRRATRSDLRSWPRARRVGGFRQRRIGRADGRGWLRASHRVRKRDQSPAGAGSGQGTRDCGSCGARRRTRSHRPSPSHGKRHAGPRGRRRRNLSRARRHPDPEGAGHDDGPIRSGQRSSVSKGGRDRSRWVCARADRDRLYRRRSDLRTGAGDSALTCRVVGRASAREQLRARQVSRSPAAIRRVDFWSSREIAMA